MSNSLWQLENVGLAQRLQSVTLRIEPGVTAVLGHSGAGKTSLLNLLVGFENSTAGKLQADLPRGSHRIPLFWVPADGGLWPHLTVAEHIAAVTDGAPISSSARSVGANQRAELELGAPA
ncbi:MAG TPA: ATP-binding cassette domain-containing protein, partial [Verrucomicrobiae bacterium]